MSSTPVVFSDQDIDQSGQSSKPITFGEDEIQSAPHDFTQEALSGKLAPVTGKPAEPKGQPYIDRAGMEHETEAVPEAAGWRDPLIHIAAGAEPVATGLSRIKDNSAPPVSPEMPMGRSRGGPAILPQAPHTPEQVQRDRQTMLGGAEVLQGTGQLGTVALPAALAAAPLKVGAGLAAGTLASEAAGKTVHGKVSPEAEELTRAAAFFIPSAAGVVSGLKTGTVETPQGKFSAASIFGGKAGAGVRTTPEGTFARVKVGGTTIEVPISRNGGAPAPEGTPAAAPAAPLPAGVTSMVKANAAEAMAKNVVAGRPPVPPPPAPPPTPGEQFGNKLSGDQVDHLAKTIADQPEAKRNGLIEEAHQNLTQWVADNKGKVIIDGKVHIAKTPDQAETLAAKLVNDAVAQHDKATAEAAKVQVKPESSQQPAKSSQEATTKPAAEVQRFLASSRPPKAATPVQELQAPTPKPVQASLGNEAAVVPPEPQTTQNLTANEVAKQEVAPPKVFSDKDIQPAHEYASTQVNIEPKSELGKRHAEAVAAMPDEHIGPNGKEETPHVTVRYGLKDDSPEAIEKIKAAAAKIAPFEATVGKTGSFPATKEGDRPIIAQVENSPELNALRSAVEGAGNFKEDTHGEYRPHVTLGYVKPEHVAKYEGGNHLEGGKVPVDHIVVSKRDGTTESIPLAERRTNTTERKRVADMNQEEMARELHTSRLDNGDGTHTEMPIPNGRAFHDAPASPAVAMSDSDGLKAFNDKFGYKAGNAILVAKGEAAKEAGLDAYHQKGDEFLYHGESPEHLKAGLEKAREILRNREFTVTDATGKQVTLKGVDFSYGTGTDLATAESGLKAHKQQREASGERARGELRGITQVGHETAAEGGSQAAAEVEPQTFHESEIEHELPEGVPAKGKSGEVPTGLLHFDPKRFQYKLNVNEKGVTNLLHGQKFNQDLAGVVSVWHDPEDGKLYVVNGHHRAQLAKETRQKELLVRHLDVATAGEARAVGALQNIAEGRGTAIDAAKFFRDRGISPEDLSKHGISLGEAKAADGLALSRLDQSLFERVATGKMSEGRGVAIGQATNDPAQQEAIVKLLDKREKQGKNITDAMVAELARFVGNSGNRTIEQGGLFGANQQIHSLALEKAEISAHIKGQISKERRVFGSVASEDKATALGQVKGQKLKAEQNKKIADAAGQAEEAYNKLSSHAGPVNDILEKSAKELASGYHKPEDVKARAYRDVRDEIRKAVTGSEGQGAGRVQEHPEHAKEDAGNADRQASVKQSSALEELRKQKNKSDEPALPGMEPHVAAEKEAVAERQGEDLSREIAAPRESISAKAGEMERNSPLFRDTEASGQSGLFGGTEVPAAKEAVPDKAAEKKRIYEEIQELNKERNSLGFKIDANRYKPTDETKALVERHTELGREIRALDDEVAKLDGQPTRSERADMAKTAAEKPFGERPAEPLKYGEPAQSQHWQVSENDFIAKRFESEARRYERAVEEQEKKVAELKPGSTKRISEESSLHFWKERLAKLKAGDDPRITQEFRNTYIKTVKDAISHGKPVPQAVIDQHSEFTKAQDARERYEKGKHTSFSNRSVAINDTMQKELGFKVKRQDGKPITDEQIEEIHQSVKDVESVIGPMADIMRGVDLTVVHTNGKFPFLMNDAAGLFSENDRRITVGLQSMFSPRSIPVFAHEIGHMIDIKGGNLLGESARLYTKGGKGYTTTALSEADAKKFKGDLISQATESINNMRKVRELLQAKKTEDLTPEEKQEIEGAKVKLGPYWREPREVFARLFEQYIANKLGKRSEAAQSPECYAEQPGYWTQQQFEKFIPKIESEINRRLDALHAKYGASATPIESQGTPQKGDTVTLADGREGTVQYVHPEMNIARVKTGDGKTVTVGLKSLKDRSGEAGFAKLDIPSAVADLVKAAHEKVFAPTENRIARGVDDTLYQLGKQYDADVLRTIKLLKSVGPTTSPEDQEAIYHHKEDSSVQLNQRQQGTLDNVVQPLMDTNSEMRAKLNKAGIPMGEDDGYIHRVVQGKNNPLERAMRGKGGTGKGNVLSKAASSLKGRRMFAAEDEDGKRVVIHRNGDTMTAFDNGSASEFAKDKPGLQVGDEFNSKDGQRWTLKQATTKEIEEHTGVRYYKNALANTVVDYLQLRRAERANDALEGMKADPEFKSLSFKPEHGEMPPDGWRTVNLPQFNGYYFEPHMAETLDRFADELRADPAGAMEKIGNLMTASLVLNPARHVYNIGNHWLVERGVTGNFNPLIWPRSAKAGIRAIKAVMTQNDDFVNALDHGAPMMSHRQDLRELHQHLVDSMLGFLQQHTDIAAKIAELGGHLNHVDMLKGLYKLGQKMTWMSNDMFFLQSIYEKELGGMKFDDAAAETAKHIPDYRIPSRVLNSPGLSKFMNSHLLTVFSRYHYGVWKSYGQMLKEVAGPESSLKDRAKGLGHMLMLGLLTFVGYELWDKLLKHVTGDPKARMVRSGASAVPYLVNEIAQGNKPPEELIQGTFTPAVLPKTAAELAFNRDLYSGGRIYDRHDPAATIAHDVGKKTLGALGPSQQAEKAERSDTPMRDFLAYQGGVTFPNTEVQSPAVRLMHEILRENMTLTPELQRQLDDKRARIQSGNLTQKERKTQLKKEALDELSYYLPHVARYSDVKKIFNAATPEEKEIIRPIMLKKAVNVMRNNPIEGEREGALQAFEER